jgi:hypothetical protein
MSFILGFLCGVVFVTAIVMFVYAILRSDGVDPDLK